MGVLHERGCQWLRKDWKVNPPMDQVALFFLFAIGCYLPSLILSVIYSLFIAEKPRPINDPSMYRYNTPDQKQVLDVLQLCRKIQEHIEKASNGAGPGDSSIGE